MNLHQLFKISFLLSNTFMHITQLQTLLHSYKTSEGFGTNLNFFSITEADIEQFRIRVCHCLFCYGSFQSTVHHILGKFLKHWLIRRRSEKSKSKHCQSLKEVNDFSKTLSLIWSRSSLLIIVGQELHFNSKSIPK